MTGLPAPTLWAGINFGHAGTASTSLSSGQERQARKNGVMDNNPGKARVQVPGTHYGRSKRGLSVGCRRLGDRHQVCNWKTGASRGSGEIRSITTNAGCDYAATHSPYACFRVGSLPLHHRDPFDRLLISQVQVEHLPIVTVDRKLEAYDVELIWGNP